MTRKQAQKALLLTIAAIADDDMRFGIADLMNAACGAGTFADLTEEAQYALAEELSAYVDYELAVAAIVAA